MKNRQKNPAERTGSRYKIEILMSWTQKLKGLAAASLGVKTFDDNPYNRRRMDVSAGERWMRSSVSILTRAICILTFSNVRN